MRIFLCTADTSGDLHASALLEALAQAEQKLEVFGLGGERLCGSALFEPVLLDPGHSQAHSLERFEDPWDATSLGFAPARSRRFRGRFPCS